MGNDWFLTYSRYPISGHHINTKKQYGIKPFFLEGGENMLKVTYHSDLAILEMLMEKYDL